MAKNIDEHRLYKTLGDPLRFAGMTVDELILGAGGFFGSMAFLNGTWSGFCAMLLSPVAVVVLKKAKKKFAGSRLRSFLYWHGFWPRPSKIYPPFHHRSYRP